MVEQNRLEQFQRLDCTSAVGLGILRSNYVENSREKQIKHRDPDRTLEKSRDWNSKPGRLQHFTPNKNFVSNNAEKIFNLESLKKFNGRKHNKNKKILTVEY